MFIFPVREKRIIKMTIGDSESPMVILVTTVNKLIFVRQREKKSDPISRYPQESHPLIASYDVHIQHFSS